MRKTRASGILVVFLGVAVTLGIVLLRRDSARVPAAPDNAPLAAPPDTDDSKGGTHRPASSLSDLEAANRLAIGAQKARESGDAERAIDLYRQSIAISPELPAVWNNLGLLLMEKEQYPEAVEAFERAAALSRTDPRPLHNAGIACTRAGWDHRALDYFLAALERAPRDLKSLQGAVSAARKLGLADEASLERVRTAIELDDNADWRRLYEREQSRIDAALRDR